RPLTAQPSVPTLNLYLYQVVPNVALRNADLPTRNGTGQPVTRPVVALDLHYLLSFYGDDSALEPQRLLGSAVRTLHAFPILTKSHIDAVVAAASAAATPLHAYLKTTDLATHMDHVRLPPLPLTPDELSKVWSIFPNVMYTLSVVYQA